MAPNLAVVTISESHVTDDSVKRLAALPKLEVANFYQTQITADAVAELQAQLPNCKITRVDSE